MVLILYGIKFQKHIDCINLKCISTVPHIYLKCSIHVHIDIITINFLLFPGSSKTETKKR